MQQCYNLSVKNIYVTLTKCSRVFKFFFPEESIIPAINPFNGICDQIDCLTIIKRFAITEVLLLSGSHHSESVERLQRLSALQTDSLVR